jgi:hypothetical protein
MFEIMESLHNRDNEDIEGFCHRSDSVAPGVDHTVDTLPGIAGGSKQTGAVRTPIKKTLDPGVFAFL